MDLSEIKTVDLIKAVIERGISAHDYQLIYSNHLKTQLRDYQERQRKRDQKQRDVKMMKIWWRYVVVRGEGIPAELDGRWYDLSTMDPALPVRPYASFEGAQFVATNMWEQRDDGEVAVVYHWSRTNC